MDENKMLERNDYKILLENVSEFLLNNIENVEVTNLSSDNFLYRLGYYSQMYEDEVVVISLNLKMEPIDKKGNKWLKRKVL